MREEDHVATSIPEVLLVEADAEDRQLYGAWLEGAGFEVMACPGPRAPEYTCIGGREGRCPLAMAADVVVLDVQLDSDLLAQGTSAGEVLSLYTSSGVPVVAIGPQTDVAGLFSETDVTWLPWPPNRQEFVTSVRRALAMPSSRPPRAARGPETRLGAGL